MNKNDLIIPFEKALGEKIFKSLNGDIITNILKIAKTDKWENLHKHHLEGYSFKVTPKISNYLYSLFEEVRNTLEFEDNVDYYIDNSATSNAYCISKDDDDEAHVLVLNSRLLETMTKEELKFIIGHEFGHLINNSNKLTRVVRFVYPKNIPTVLKHKLSLWNKLSELTADRYGLIACGDIHIAIAVFLKLSSGLDPNKISLNLNEFMRENIQRVDELEKDEYISSLSHPVNPARIKAIELFSRSELYPAAKETDYSVDTLNEEIYKLMDILEFGSNDELDLHRKIFIATGGIIAATLDEELCKDEYKHIVKMLSDFTTFPARFLNRVIESGKVTEYFEKSVKTLLNVNPSERYAMFSYFIDIAMTDHNLNAKEIAFLFDMGENMFGFTKKEAAQQIAHKIQDDYIPDVYTG